MEGSGGEGRRKGVGWGEWGGDEIVEVTDGGLSSHKCTQNLLLHISHSVYTTNRSFIVLKNVKPLPSVKTFTLCYFHSV